MKTLRRVLIIILLAVAFFAGYMLWKELSAQKKDKDNFDTLAKLVEMVEPTEEAGEKETDPSAPRQSDAPTEPTEPKVTHKRNLAPLFEENCDCVGWLSIPGTVLDYPVMYTPLDPQKYLRRNFYGEYSYSGVPFLDGECSLEDGNLIFYGHSMKNGTMFGCLLDYLDVDFWMDHPILEYEAQDGLDTYRIFAVVELSAEDAWYTYLETGSEERFDRNVGRMLEKAKYDTGVVPAYGDRLLTLSTCYGSEDDGRLIVIAVRENPEV